MEHRALVDHVSFVTIHILPYWEDHPVAIDVAIAHIVMIAKEMRIAFRRQGHPDRRDRLAKCRTKPPGGRRQPREPGAGSSASSAWRPRNTICATTSSRRSTSRGSDAWRVRWEGSGACSTATAKPSFRRPARWRRIPQAHSWPLRRRLLGLLLFVLVAAAPRAPRLASADGGVDGRGQRRRPCTRNGSTWWSGTATRPSGLRPGVFAVLAAAVRGDRACRPCAGALAPGLQSAGTPLSSPPSAARASRRRSPSQASLELRRSRRSAPCWRHVAAACAPARRCTGSSLCGWRSSSAARDGTAAGVRFPLPRLSDARSTRCRSCRCCCCWPRASGPASSIGRKRCSRPSSLSARWRSSRWKGFRIFRR